MNKEKAQRLIEISERAIEIIRLALKEIPAPKIAEKTGCSRQLAEYYIKQVQDE